jgi:hypothetical protein
MIGNPGGSFAAANFDASMRRALARAATAGILAAAMAVLPTSASADSPIAISPPDNANSPLIAYDTVSSTTFVAWQDPVQPAVDLCILPANATACAGGGPVLLEDSAAGIFTGAQASGPGAIVVLPGGKVAVIGDSTTHGSIAWVSSAPDGSGFLASGQGLQNGGNPISQVSLFYSFDNAAALSSTDVGLLDSYADYFGDTNLMAPDPAIPAPNTNQTTPAGEFPRHPLQTDGPAIATMPAPAPAPSGSEIVVGAADNFGGPSMAIPGCLNMSATGYGVSVGTVNGTSNGAGTLNAAGLPAYHLLTCSAEEPVLASGGQSGIGVLEGEGNGYSGAGSTYTMDFRPFLATATGGTFGAAVELQDVTNESLGGPVEIDAADDSGTGVYTSWIDHQGLVLDYSANGGASFGGAVVDTLPNNINPGNPVIAGVGGGSLEVAFQSNPGTGKQVFLQRVSYQALAVAPDTITTAQASGSTTGSSISIPAGTTGETDRASVVGANGSRATGTVTYTLYAAPTCAAASKVFGGGTTAVSGGVAAASAGVSSALAPGKYYWQAVYSGDAFNVPNTSACGSEILTVSSAVSGGTRGTSNGTTITITITCATTPCTITITITFGASHGVRGVASRKAKAVKVASGTFKLKKKGKAKLAVRLTSAGKRLLRQHHNHLKASILFSVSVHGHAVKQTGTIKIS